MLKQKESWTDATDDTETKTLAIKTLNCQDEERQNEKFLSCPLIFK